MEKKIVITGTADRGSMRRMMPAAPCTRRPLDPISQLQQTGGNQAVQRLFESSVIQAKLTVGPPNDIYEQEADRVADQVMRMTEPSVDAVQRKPGWPFAKGPSCGDEEAVQAKFDPVVVSSLIQKNGEEEKEVQRQPEDEEEKLQRQPEKEEEELRKQPEEEEEKIQAKGEAIDERTPPDFVENRVQASGGGQVLSENVRSFFEPRFNQDFSRVRVHADSGSVEMAKSIQAQAFTHGRDIYFGAGKYNPEGSAGKQLLAHELTHVIQQTEKE